MVEDLQSEESDEDDSSRGSCCKTEREGLQVPCQWGGVAEGNRVREESPLWVLPGH